MIRGARARRALIGGLTVGVIGVLAGCASTSVPVSSPSADPTPVVSPPEGGAILWSDDFSGSAGELADPDDWVYALGAGGWGNNELQTYTEQNAVLDGSGHLVLRAVIDDALPDGDPQKYTSARLETVRTFGDGVLEARIRIPDGPGLLPAFWMLGADIAEVGYPASGEIDIVETPVDTTHTTHTVHALDPRDSSAGSHGQLTIDIEHAPGLSDDFHVYGVRKEAGLLVFLIDGEEVGRVAQDEVADRLAWPFDQPFTALFSLAIGGNWPGSPTADTARVSEMTIDWVRFRELD